MNERIKLLIEQATTYIDPIANDGVCWDFKVTTCWDFDKEKFAQLIVRECVEIANNHNEEIEGVTLGVGQALKKHFGVEE